MRQRTGTAILLLALLGLLWACPSLQAADEGPLSVKGTKQFGVNIGYGYSFCSNRDIRFAPLYPFFGYVFTDPVGAGWYRGTGEWIIEGDFNYVYKGQARHATGINVMGRYNLLSKHESWRPYVQFGFGMLGTNLSMRGLGMNFNFSTNLGAGIQYFWNSCNAINFEWRFKHISNCELDAENDGLNMNMLLLGYSYTF
jgi:hypothetical protein